MIVGASRKWSTPLKIDFLTLPYCIPVGYPASDVIYEWHYGNALAAVASNDMRLSQFDLKGMPATNTTKSFKGSE